MISLTVIFGILIIHWIADFILQSDEDAKGKSTSLKHLLSHTISYSVSWIIPLLIFVACQQNINIQHEIHKTFDFVMITFVAHTITDYFTSRLNARLWQQERRHAFFVAIGFDQILHYFQLLLTYYFIFN